MATLHAIHADMPPIDMRVLAMAGLALVACYVGVKVCFALADTLLALDQEKARATHEAARADVLAVALLRLRGSDLDDQSAA